MQHTGAHTPLVCTQPMHPFKTLVPSQAVSPARPACCMPRAAAGIRMQVAWMAGGMRLRKHRHQQAVHVKHNRAQAAAHRLWQHQPSPSSTEVQASVGHNNNTRTGVPRAHCRRQQPAAATHARANTTHTTAAQCQQRAPHTACHTNFTPENQSHPVAPPRCTSLHSCTHASRAIAKQTAYFNAAVLLAP